MTMQTPDNSSSTPPAQTQNPNEAFQNLLQRTEGGVERLARQLFTENYELRDERRQLREQTAALQSKAVPEGHVAIPENERTLFEQYKQLGSPEELQTRTATLQNLQRDLSIEQAARVAGMKASVLKTLARELQLEVRTETVEGKTVEKAVVVQGQTATPLDQYAGQHWSDFLPSLQDGKAGTTFVQQTPGQKPPKSSAVEEFLQKRDERNKASRNPLVKP